MFYERLFYMAPSLRQMFPTDMRDQKRKLMVMLASAVQGLDNLDMLAPQLMALGARHARYGVKDQHYKAVGDALIWTLERGLANAWTPEVERAWVRVYLLMAATMQAGAERLVDDRLERLALRREAFTDPHLLGTGQCRSKHRPFFHAARDEVRG